MNGDAQQLQQLLGIMLDNARKYCPNGGDINVSLSETDKRNILLSVFNEGEPIPEDELEQIFLRFYRLDKSRSAHDSFGLGLSIAERIVNEHGGKMWAESDDITGNSFYVTLPMKK